MYDPSKKDQEIFSFDLKGFPDILKFVNQNDICI